MPARLNHPAIVRSAVSSSSRALAHAEVAGEDAHEEGGQAHPEKCGEGDEAGMRQPAASSPLVPSLRGIAWVSRIVVGAFPA